MQIIYFPFYITESKFRPVHTAFLHILKRNKKRGRGETGTAFITKKEEG